MTKAAIANNPGKSGKTEAGVMDYPYASGENPGEDVSPQKQRVNQAVHLMRIEPKESFGRGFCVMPYH